MDETFAEPERDEPPMYSAAALGFRAWRVSPEGYLVSLGAGQTAWRVGSNLAYCREHRAPRTDCHCGLYACHTLDDARRRTASYQHGEVLYGAVAARGRVKVHHHGFRAEEAVICALAAPPDASPRLLALAEREAAKYGVPLVAFAELEACGARYAQAVPAALRPPEPPDEQRLLALRLLPGSQRSQVGALTLLVCSALLAAVCCGGFVMMVTMTPSPWDLGLGLAAATALALTAGQLLLRYHVGPSLVTRPRLRQVCTLLGAALRPLSYLMLLVFVLGALVGGSVGAARRGTQEAAGDLNKLLAAAQRHQEATSRYPQLSKLPAFAAASASHPGLHATMSGDCLLVRWDGGSERLCPIE